jgi:hypothetical protein
MLTSVRPQFMDIWNRMYRERILYIGQDLDDEFANQVICPHSGLRRYFFNNP